MEQRHRDAIQNCFSSLVEQTDLDLMVTALYEKGVFSEAMIEPYKDVHIGVRHRKRLLYLAVPQRGPDAFRHLLDALMENGYWDLVRALDPESPLNRRQRQGDNFLSLFDKKRTAGKEQNEPPSKPPQDPRTPHSEPRVPTPQNIDPPGPGPSGDTQAAAVPFKVIKSPKFAEDNGSDIKLYRTRGKFRGVLLLFSYIAFERDIEEYREGARVDSDNLRYLFNELGFKVISYLNLSLQETKQTLKQLPSGIIAEGPETVFVVFSSHGYARPRSADTDIRCSNGGLISYFDIIDYFNNENFPKLNGIPKVFIFQTCRGDNKDYVRAPMPLSAPGRTRSPPAAGAVAGAGPGAGAGAGRTARDGRRYESEVDATATHDSDDDRRDSTVDRMYSDILIAHSTVPGYASKRDKISGSWYIQTVCEVFAARAHDCHVEKLFTLVDRQLERRFRTQTSSVDRWGFNRRLYLNPGLCEP